VAGDGALYELKPGGKLWQYRSSPWSYSLIADNASAITVAEDGSLYVLAGGKGSLYTLKDSAGNPTVMNAGDLWQLQYGSPGTTAYATGVKSIVAAEDGLYDLDANGQLYRSSDHGDGQAGEGKVLTRNPTPIACNVSAVAVARNDVLYGLTTDNNLWQHQFGSWSATGDVGVQAIAVAGDGSLNKLTTDNNLWQYQYNGYQGGAWGTAAIRIGVQSIAVGGDGSLYALVQDGSLVQCQFRNWSTIDAGVQSIAVSNDGSLYVLMQTGYLWQYRFGSLGSGPIDSGVKKIVVDWTGTLYDLKTDKSLWSYQFGVRSTSAIATNVTSLCLDANGKATWTTS
jgi:hypothetical protein